MSKGGGQNSFIGNQGAAAGTPKAGSGSQAPTVGYNPYPNQQVAPMTPMQTQAMQGVQNLTDPMQQYMQNTINQNQAMQNMGGGSQATNQQLQGAAGSAMPMQNWLSSGAAMNPATNQYLQQYFNAAAQPLEQQFQQTIAPNLMANAAQTGTLGSAGQAQGMQNAQTSLAQGLGNLAAGIYEPAYQQGLQATQNAVNQGLNTGLSASTQGMNTAQNAQQMAPGLQSAMYNPAAQQYQYGQYGQQQAQNQLQQAYQNMQNQANWPFQALSMFGQGLQGASGTGQISSGTQISPSSAMGK